MERQREDETHDEGEDVSNYSMTFRKTEDTRH
jgi:hypothetical protein